MLTVFSKIWRSDDPFMRDNDWRDVRRVAVGGLAILIMLWLAALAWTTPARSAERSVSLSGVVSTLAAKAREIQQACGSVIVSAVSGRGYKSNHPIGRAVDIKGNPSCIKAHLAGWPGGLSTDYSSAPGGPHYHVSYNPGGQEWGLRFAHRHSSTRTRSASRRGGVRVASARSEVLTREH